MLEEEPDLEQPEQAESRVADGSVDFDHVSFKYRAEAEKFALHDVTLHIAAGKPSASSAAPARPKAPWCS